MPIPALPSFSFWLLLWWCYCSWKWLCCDDELSLCIACILSWSSFYYYSLLLLLSFYYLLYSSRFSYSSVVICTERGLMPFFIRFRFICVFLWIMFGIWCITLYSMFVDIIISMAVDSSNTQVAILVPTDIPPTTVLCHIHLATIKLRPRNPYYCIVLICRLIIW